MHNPTLCSRCKRSSNLVVSKVSNVLTNYISWWSKHDQLMFTYPKTSLIVVYQAWKTNMWLDLLIWWVWRGCFRFVLFSQNSEPSTSVWSQHGTGVAWGGGDFDPLCTVLNITGRTWQRDETPEWMAQYPESERDMESVTLRVHVCVDACVRDWPRRALEGSEFVPCEALLLRDDEDSEKSLVRFCWLRSRLRRPWCCGLYRNQKFKFFKQCLCY